MADEKVHDLVTKVLAVVAAVLLWPTFSDLVTAVWANVVDGAGTSVMILGVAVGLLALFGLYATVSYLMGLSGMVTLRRLGVI
jgi:hypothetical protein